MYAKVAYLILTYLFCKFVPKINISGRETVFKGPLLGGVSVQLPTEHRQLASLFRGFLQAVVTAHTP